MPEVVIGKDEVTGKLITIGDIERRSGLYILGKPGMGKSALLVNIMNQDVKHGHSLFFLDPHIDAITDLLNRGDYGLFCSFAKVLDPEDEKYSFGINLLSCRDITSLRERTATYTKAYNVFYKLWEDEWGPWLQLILQNTLWAFIENPDYTLAEVPMFLNPRNERFREHIIGNIKYNPAVVDFWKYEFFERRERDQQERVDAALTRVTTLLTHPYIRHIIGQRKTTVDFDAILKPPIPTILLVKLSANLAADIKKFVGTILISELLHAVRNRPEREREQFCIFVDEFQNFTNSEDFTTLITEGRKFGISTTICHVERYGQFAENQKLLGATLAAVNKVFFQLTVKDAEEQAPEFAKEATTTETRLEPGLAISQNPFFDLLRRGHPNPRIQELVHGYLQPMQDNVVRVREEMEAAGLMISNLEDESALIRDDASIYRLEDQMEGVVEGRTSSTNYSMLQSAMNALENARNIRGQATGRSAELLGLFRRFTMYREWVRNTDRFLLSLMEGRIAPVPGQEGFAQFLLDIFGNGYVTFTYLDLLRLYLSLEFGNPKTPRSVPGRFWNKRWFMSTKGYVPAEYDRPMPNQPPRVLPVEEIQAYKDMCRDELLEAVRSGYSRNPFEVLDNLIEFCNLLSKPENHIKVPSGQYIEKPVSVRLVSDMTNEMAQELANLPRFTAWTKVIDESNGEQIVLKQKIKTLPLPPLQETPKGKPDIETRVIANGYSLCKERVHIEDEIRERQKRWRRNTASRKSPPTAEGPPRAHS